MVTGDVRDHGVGDQTMDGMLRWHALHHPNETAVVCGERRMSWAELDARSNRLANALLSLGLRRGDRVGLLLGNCAEYIEIYQALAKTGLTAVPVNTALTEPEVGYILEDSGSAALLYDGARASVVSQLAAGGRLAIEPGRRVQLGSGAAGGYDDLLAAASAAPPTVEVGADDCFFQGYTSGTTGRPKGCVQRHSAFVAHYKRSFRAYRHDDRDVMLIPGPLFHEAPTLFTLGQLFHGGAVVVLPAFSPEAAFAAVERERCTMVGFAVPTMLARMTEGADSADSADVSSVRSIITAGAPLHEETMDATLRRFPSAELHEFYGATELGLITDVQHRRHRDKGATVGRALPGVGVVVLDDGDQPVPTGEVGQVFVTPIMMDGYHHREDATATGTREFGGVHWFTLGDVGHLDDDGFLYLVDRKSHMIITGGENVYPAEVEAVLLDHPGIADVAVIGLPDPRWGEAVTAVIADSAHAPDASEIKDFCRNRLAGYKIPKQVVQVDEIPRNPSGKILKHVLRQQVS